MPRPRTIIDPDDLRRLRAEGKTITELCRILRTSSERFKEEFAILGLPHFRKQRSLLLDPSEAIIAFQAGESILSISRRLGVGRGVISQRLIEAGVDLRTRSQAAYVRMAQTEFEDRRRLGAKARDARKERGAGLHEQLKAALTRSRLVGRGEAELIEVCRSRNIPAEGQWPCGIYNIDVAIGPVAVELISASNYRSRLPGFVERAKYLRDCGYSLIVVVFIRTGDVSPSFDDVVALAQRTYCLPSADRKD